MQGVDAHRPPSEARGPTVRRRLLPGDLGAIVAHHGVAYAREYGLDASFEAHVGVAVGEAGARGWPDQREGAWIVEHDGRHAGSLGLTDEGGGLAALRWFLLDEEVRGHGLGRRLVGELVREARAGGYHTVRLETFSELTAAARLYREHGFELVGAETGPRWGRDQLTYQRYELALSSAPDLAGSAPSGSSQTATGAESVTSR